MIWDLGKIAQKKDKWHFSIVYLLLYVLPGALETVLTRQATAKIKEGLRMRFISMFLSLILF